MTGASDINGTITNSYNALNQLTASTDVFGLTVSYAYDADGNQTSEQDSAGGVVTSTYNTDDLLTSRELGGSGITPLLATFSYDNNNEIIGETRYANLAGTTEVGVTSDGYDSSGRLTTITLQNASGTTLAYYDYSYDNADRVTQQTWSSTTSTGTLSGSETYGYDAASQLTNDGSTMYSYDQNGNRTIGGYTTGTDNELTTDGTYNYSYDAEGNLIQKVSVSGPTTTWTYSYSVTNQLVGITETVSGSTALQVTYTYDVLGERVAQSEWIGGTATVTRFAYDDNGNVWAELSSSNVVQTRYLWGDGTDQILAREDGTTAYWYQTDNLGSVRDVFASSGSDTYVLDHVNYSAFGVITTETNAAVGGRLKYTAEPWDANTGLQYNDARYYNPATGDWISQDPAESGSNWYEYVGNDPTNATDPSGEQGDFFEDRNDVGADRARAYAALLRPLKIPVKLSIADLAEAKKAPNAQKFFDLSDNKVKTWVTLETKNKNVLVQGAVEDNVYYIRYFYGVNVEAKIPVADTNLVQFVDTSSGFRNVESGKQIGTTWGNEYWEAFPWKAQGEYGTVVDPQGEYTSTKQARKGEVVIVGSTVDSYVGRYGNGLVNKVQVFEKPAELKLVKGTTFARSLVVLYLYSDGRWALVGKELGIDEGGEIKEKK